MKPHTSIVRTIRIIYVRLLTGPDLQLTMRIRLENHAPVSRPRIATGCSENKLPKTPLLNADRDSAFNYSRARHAKDTTRPAKQTETEDTELRDYKRHSKCLEVHSFHRQRCAIVHFSPPASKVAMIQESWDPQATSRPV